MLKQIKKKDDKSIAFGEGLFARIPEDQSITPQDSIQSTDSQPYFTVKEVAEKAIVDRGSNNYTYAHLEFFNTSKLPNVSKICIYYSLGPTILPNSINLLWLQTNTKLGEIDLLQLSSSTSQDYRVLLTNNPITEYSFFVIYKDTDGNVIEYNNRIFIIYDLDIVFSGLTLKQTVLGAKEVTIDYKTDLIDMDKVGYDVPLEIDSVNVTLNWLDHRTLSNVDTFNNYLNAGLFFDTFGKQYNISSALFQAIDYYVVYQFTSSNGKKPNIMYPLHVNPTDGLIPQLEDRNGTWQLMLQTTNNSAQLIVTENSLIGFWVGIKLK